MSGQEFLFSNEINENEVIQEHSLSWKVLIVDDDPEIHAVTKLALSDLSVFDRNLEYLHAYSGAEAKQILLEHDDIALILLDVVMESEDAGLKVVKYIRDELSRADVRIVLRTGQPGYAPEESVIKSYDINDYKTKTELTRRKLVNAVYVAIRSYQQINTIEHSRSGLQTVIDSCAQLLDVRELLPFTEDVLVQVQKLLELQQPALFCAQGKGFFEGGGDSELHIFAAVGYENKLVGQPIQDLNNTEAISSIKECFLKHAHIFNQHGTFLYLSASGRETVIYIEGEISISDLHKQLLDVFLSNISVGLENVDLFKRLQSAAYQDFLTGLPNRLQFIDMLDEFTTSEEPDLVACLLDIERFSDVNDGLGQQLGNQLLISVAARLQGSLGAYCKIARIGADVFGLIGSGQYLTPEKISEVFDAPFQVGEHLLPLSSSLGLAHKKDSSEVSVETLNQINIALNIAKKQSKEKYYYYTMDLERVTTWRLETIRKLRAAFNNEELQLWLQPKFSLLDQQVIGAEALLRWPTPDGRFISPAVFIPLAEDSGLILDIGAWVIKKAGQQMKILEQNGFNDVSISVNVSIPQFRQANFAQSVIDEINSQQVDAHKIELEITENILMDEPDVVIDSLNTLKASGFTVALDDFGTGYSSLSYLRKLPLDRVKIDRSFVNEITEEGGLVLPETIVKLGHTMNLKVIAEGVEDEVQQQHLINLGCDEVQGFYYAKPMDFNKFLEFMKKRS